MKRLRLILCTVITGCAFAVGAGGLLNAAEHPGAGAKEHPSSPMPMAKGGLLDGKTFRGDYGPMGKAAEGTDDFIFKNGSFRSTACDQYGFGTGRYTASQAGNAIHFQATTTSPQEGSIQWNGDARGNALEGTFEWSPPNKPVMQYWFKASLKQ